MSSIMPHVVQIERNGRFRAGTVRADIRCLEALLFGVIYIYNSDDLNVHMVCNFFEEVMKGIHVLCPQKRVKSFIFPSQILMCVF